MQVRPRPVYQHDVGGVTFVGMVCILWVWLIGVWLKCPEFLFRKVGNYYCDYGAHYMCVCKLPFTSQRLVTEGVITPMLHVCRQPLSCRMSEGID